MASPIPGEIFIYRHRRRFFRKQSGAGQVLGYDPIRKVVFLRLFAVGGDELTVMVGFLPISRDAYDESQPRGVKMLEIGNDWESACAEWEERSKAGEAGIFSRPLHELAPMILKSVPAEVLNKDHSLIVSAYPKRASGDRFDTIAAVVEQRRQS